MRKFHINNRGEVNPCSAKDGDCPFGSVFSTYDEAIFSPEYKKKNSNVVKFESALRKLDSKLKRVIEVRAIGGFAVLHYTQTDRFSREIDSYVKNEFTNEEEKIIEQIGIEFQLDNSWLNNRWAASSFSDDIFDNAKWEKIDYGFKNIDFYVVSIEDLLESKFRACNIDESDEDYVFRGSRDIQDIFAITKNVMKIVTIKDMKNKLKTLFDKYPITARLLQDNEHAF